MEGPQAEDPGPGVGRGSGCGQRMRVQAEGTEQTENVDAVHGCDHIAGSNECGPDGDETRRG